MKSASILLSLCACLILASCSTYVTVSEDPYIKATVVKYDDSHKVIEGDLKNERVCYTRLVKGKEKEPISVELEFSGMVHIMTNYAGDELDEPGYVLIDNESFPVKLVDRKNNQNVMMHGRINESGGLAGAGYSSSGSIKIGSTTFCRLRAKFMMTPEMERALLNAEKMSIRVSTGGKPIILKVSSGQIDMLRELASFTPGQKS